MFFAFFLLAPISAANAADGTTGTIDLDQTSVTDGTTIYVHFEGLTASADYLVNWTGDNTGFSWTCGASQDDIYIPIKFEKPAGSNAFLIYLRYQSAGTMIDTVTVHVNEADTILDTTAFLAIVIPLLIFAIIVTIYKSVGKAKTKGR